MMDCKCCRNDSICKWIEEREKVKAKLDKIALKEGSPFLLACDCSCYVDKEELIIEEELSKMSEHKDIEEIVEEEIIDKE